MGGPNAMVLADPIRTNGTPPMHHDLHARRRFKIGYMAVMGFVSIAFISETLPRTAFYSKRDYCLALGDRSKWALPDNVPECCAFGEAIVLTCQVSPIAELTGASDKCGCATTAESYCSEELVGSVQYDY